MKDASQSVRRQQRPPSRTGVRVRAALGLLVLLALAIAPVWYLTRPAGTLRVSGRVVARSLAIEIPAGAVSPELGIRAHRRVSLEAANLYAKGFAGTVTVPDDEVTIEPETDFVLLADGDESGLDLATPSPLSVRLPTDQRLEITLATGRMDLGPDQPAVPSITYGIRAPGRVQGALRAGTLRLQGAGGLTYGERPVQTLDLQATAEDTPLGFSAAADGAPLRLRVALDTSRQDWAIQQVQATAHRVTTIDSSGRVLLAGRPAAAPTGLEEVEVTGTVQVSDVEVVEDRVAVSIRGTAQDLRVEGESLMPTPLERLAVHPLWIAGFAVVLVVWAALVAPVMRTLLTGSWGSE